MQTINMKTRFWSLTAICGLHYIFPLSMWVCMPQSEMTKFFDAILPITLWGVTALYWAKTVLHQCVKMIHLLQIQVIQTEKKPCADKLATAVRCSYWREVAHVWHSYSWILPTIKRVPNTLWIVHFCYVTFFLKLPCVTMIFAFWLPSALIHTAYA